VFVFASLKALIFDKRGHSNMDTLDELTGAECEMVAGGGGGQIVADFNHHSGHGPGFFFQEGTGSRPSSAVHEVQTGAPNPTVPFWNFLNRGMGIP
jgi:hypothetical protein